MLFGAVEENDRRVAGGGARPADGGATAARGESVSVGLPGAEVLDNAVGDAERGPGAAVAEPRGINRAAGKISVTRFGGRAVCAKGGWIEPAQRCRLGATVFGRHAGAGHDRSGADPGSPGGGAPSASVGVRPMFRGAGGGRRAFALPGASSERLPTGGAANRSRSAEEQDISSAGLVGGRQRDSGSLRRAVHAAAPARYGGVVRVVSDGVEAVASAIAMIYPGAAH